MQPHTSLQLITFVVAVIVCVPLLGRYIAYVYSDSISGWVYRLLGGLERIS